MNRGVLQLQSPVPPVQQMMVTGNPNYNYGWWNNNYNMQVMSRVPQLLPSSTSFQLPHFLPPPPPSSASSSSSSSSSTWHGEYNFHQDLLPPESWSQFLMGGIMGRDVEDRCGSDHDELGKKVENWDQEHHHVLLNQAAAEDHLSNSDVLMKEFLIIKQENVANYNSDHAYNSHGAGGVQVHHQDIDQLIHQQPSGATPAANNWSQMILMQSAAVASTPNLKKSCGVDMISTNNMLDFSTNKPYLIPRPPLHPDHSSQCNSSSTTGSTGEPAVKKARVQASASHSTQATFKVRKEKLGDRITALHQLVSPFGKTDTASVLLEAIGYIRFLQSQVEALSLPYLGGGAGNISHQLQPVQVERNCLFPDDPGQLLNGHCIKRKGAPDHQDYHHEEQKKDLRSRGLCLVPISCTMQVESSNGADYWTPAAAFGGGFR